MVSQPPEEETTALLGIAARLLEMQQRMAAFDRLYNQEIADLSRRLTELKDEFVQHHLRPAVTVDVEANVKRPRRKAQSARLARPLRRQSSSGEISTEKE